MEHAATAYKTHQWIHDTTWCNYTIYSARPQEIWLDERRLLLIHLLLGRAKTNRNIMMTEDTTNLLRNAWEMPLNVFQTHNLYRELHLLVWLIKAGWILPQTLNCISHLNTFQCTLILCWHCQAVEGHGWTKSMSVRHVHIVNNTNKWWTFAPNAGKHWRGTVNACCYCQKLSNHLPGSTQFQSKYCCCWFMFKAKICFWCGTTHEYPCLIQPQGSYCQMWDHWPWQLTRHIPHHTAVVKPLTIIDILSLRTYGQYIPCLNISSWNNTLLSWTGFVSSNQQLLEAPVDK